MEGIGKPPIEKKSQRVFRIIDTCSGEAVGSYSRAYHDKYDFGSAESARNANCHNKFQDRKKYNIAEYEVTYKLIDSNVD